MLDFAALMAGSIEPVTAGDVILACDLADRYGARPGARLAARDLLHAAVLLRAEGGAAKIVSADRGFDELVGEGIERLDPTDIEIWRQEVERGRVS